MFRFKLTTYLILLGSMLLLGSSRARAAEPDWPREIDAPEATIVLYQPQPETFHGNILTARIAVAVTPTGETTPVYGTVWTTSRIETDRDQRTVTIVDLTVTRLKFPDSTGQQEQTVSRILQREVPKWNLTLSLDRLEASLLNAPVEQASAAGLRTTPPRIRFASEPSILVTIDGAPQLRPVENSSLQRVVNTPFPLIYDPGAAAYYLNGGKLWYSAPNIKGPWTLIENPPGAVAAIVPKDAGEAATGTPASGPAPRIVVATEPTELIVTDGAPQYTSLMGTDLLYMTNTESDVVLDINSQQYYVLLSGRWFRSRSLAGPWSSVLADQLPATFQMIPPRSTRGDVRAHVAGTDEARIAVIDTQIPQTAAIPRGPANLVVTYDGPPEFKAIPGTTIEYAVNTSSSVLRIRGKFYACDQGAWYVSLGPTGPWTVATAVPPEVQTIPPSCPLYNTRYVYVYECTPTVVYVGYTPAYCGCYPYGGAVVWGTGYYYTPWVGTCFYPWPATWGFVARYNSWGGWSFGLSYNRGPFFLAFGDDDDDRRFHHRRWWGPDGYRGSTYVNVRNTGYYLDRPRFNAVDGGHDLYRRQAGFARDLQAHRLQSAGAFRDAPGQANNVFARRNGEIYRRTDSGWEVRGHSGWTPSGRGGFGRPASAGDPGLASPGGRRISPAPEGGFNQRRGFSPFQAGQIGSAPARYSIQHPLEPDYRAREMGRSREGSYRMQGSSSRSGGGLEGGGGGRGSGGRSSGGRFEGGGGGRAGGGGGGRGEGRGGGSGGRGGR